MEFITDNYTLSLDQKYLILVNRLNGEITIRERFDNVEALYKKVRNCIVKNYSYRELKTMVANVWQ